MKLWQGGQRTEKSGRIASGCSLFAFKSAELRAKKEAYHQKELVLQQQIEAEEERALEIEEFEKYTQTKKYIEEVARDKLGLVYDGEVLFKDED